MSEASQQTHCGRVALVGRPNAGKSTLLNRLIGEKIAIVSDKPQTTRHRVLGILTVEDTQAVFVDTPGIHRPGYRLNERMMDAVYDALKGVDMVVHLVDVSESYGKGEEYAVEMMKATEGPRLLALNKVDLINKGKVLPLIEFYSQFGIYDEIVPISAATGDNLGALVEAIRKRLPEGAFLYDPDQFTDQLERTLVAEIIREKVLANTRKELPYASATKLEVFDESRRDDGFVHIAASIVVEKPGQKKIVIGRGGSMIKKIGTEARREIQRLLDVPKVYLELNVKEVPGWRNRDHLLDELGVGSAGYTGG